MDTQINESQPTSPCTANGTMPRSRISARAAALPASPIRRFFEIAATMDNVISLSIGEPDFVTPTPVMEAGMRSLRAGHTSYTDNSGLLELREAILAHWSRLYDCPAYDPVTEVLVTVGVSEATQLAFDAILDPGDEVIIPQPCFVSFTAAVQMAGGVPVPLPTSVENDFQVTVADIEKRLTPRTKALMLSFPNNPTGAVLDRPLLTAIADLAARRDLLVIADEIYDRLVYGDHAHVMFAGLPDMRERTIHLGGFSKDYAMTGWRIGFALGPREVLSAMRRIHQYLIMSAPTMGQEAALAALTLPEAEEHVQRMVAAYDARRRVIVAGLNELGMPCFEPKGAFYAFPSIARTGMEDTEFAEKLLMEEQVAVIPGSAFGEGGAGYVRCCYAASMEDIEEALRRMRNFMHRHG